MDLFISPSNNSHKWTKKKKRRRRESSVMFVLYVSFDEVTYYSHLFVASSLDFVDHRLSVIQHWCKYLGHCRGVLRKRNDVWEVDCHSPRLSVRPRVQQGVHLWRRGSSRETWREDRASRKENKRAMFCHERKSRTNLRFSGIRMACVLFFIVPSGTCHQFVHQDRSIGSDWLKWRRRRRCSWIKTRGWGC